MDTPDPAPRIESSQWDTSLDERSGLLPARGEANADWIADQRFVHGLLRAMHSADAQAREARVASILGRIAQKPRHNWRHVAAAALLLSALTVPLVLADELPEARAAVLRGAALLADGGDRRFRVETTGLDPQRADTVQQSFELVARPGMHFVITGALTMGPIHFADMRFGCDGQQFWFHSSGGSEAVRRSGPLDEAPALLRGIGNVLDLGLLDVHRMVQQLPHDFALRAEGRTVDAEQRQLVHVEATGGPRRPGFRLHRADLWCDEATGMIVKLEVEADDGLGRAQRLSFQDLGTVSVSPTIYERPW
jgi:hypothetical protein